MTQLTEVRAVCKVALPAEPPERFQIMPWGEFPSNVPGHGDTPTLADEETLRLIVAAFNERKIDGRIDYNHQSDDPDFAATGKPALILGYFKGFVAVAGDGIYVTGVTWTPPGAELVRNLQARYPSYVGYIRRSDHRVIEVSSVALTPNPAIPGIQPVVNKRDKMETRNMDCEKFERSRYWLNLPETATHEEIIMEFEKYISQLREMLNMEAKATGEQVVNALKARLDGDVAFRKAVCAELKLADTAKPEDVVKAVNAAKTTTPNPAEFVPAGELAKATARIATLETNELARNTADYIQRGTAAGKIVTANKGMWERLYQAGPEQAEKDLSAAPVIAPPNGHVVNTRPATAASAGGDAIAVNAHQFDADRMGDYERVANYAKDKNISFERAMAECPNP